MKKTIIIKVKETKDDRQGTLTYQYTKKGYKFALQFHYDNLCGCCNRKIMVKMVKQSATSTVSLIQHIGVDAFRIAEQTNNWDFLYNRMSPEERAKALTCVKVKLKIV